VLFFAGLYALSFPQPMCDDLFYIGAGLNLASGGDFSNPFLERAAFPGPHHYFDHPPLFSYAVAGWLKLFGISARSLLAFQMLTYLLICRTTLAIFRRHHFPPLLEWLLPLAVASAFLPTGLRFEAFSVALTMAGLALMDGGGLRLPGMFFGFLLLFLGASAASRVTFFSGALVLLALVNLRCRKVPVVTLGLTAGAAFLAVFGLFLLMINGHLVEFWQNYMFATNISKHAGGSPWRSLNHYLFVIQGITWLPLHLLWLAALPGLLFFKDRELGRMGLFAALPVLLLLVMGALGDGVIWYVFLVLFIAVAGWSSALSRFRRRTLQLIFTVALLAANARYGLVVAGLLGGQIQAGPAGPAEVLVEARSLKSAPGHTVLIDQATARYVFDYRIPPGFLDWNYGTPLPGTLAIESPPHPGDLFLLGPGNVEIINQRSRLNRPVSSWKPFASNRWWFARYPETVYLINPLDCVGLPGVTGPNGGGPPPAAPAN